MIKCSNCNEVSGIVKAGKQIYTQRYFCKHCKKYFTIKIDKQKKHKIKDGVTIKDLAQKLGFGISTISRALNSSNEINKETRRIILEAAESMGYQKNLTAISLVKQQSFTIGIIVPELKSDFYSTLITGANQILKNKGYRIYIMQSEELYENEVANTNALIASRVDGIITSTTFETKDFSHFTKAMQKNIPIVFFSRINNELESPKVAVDNYLGACMATEHLIEKGYKKIGYLGGGKDFHIGNIRYKGFYDTLHKHNIKHQDKFILRHDHLINKPSEYIHQYLKSKNRPDAVFAMTDTIGIEVIKSAKTIGINIPDHLGIIGFSDHIVSRYITPSLSSIKQPTMEIGMEAATRLMNLIENNHEKLVATDRTTLLKPELVARDSTNKAI
ncbi:MAG: LacI family DNA-binding transcriptional regulator [Chitinophagia bacterium]|jgi:LacI family transcriptional regulator